MEDATRSKYTTREEWLMEAIELERPWFKDAGSPLPAKLRVSCGFPLGSRKAIGQCFQHGDADKVQHIFISPVLGVVAAKNSVLETLTHELCHAALPIGSGHKRPFAKLGEAVGLEGPPWTATSASPDLVQRFERIARILGAYPHAILRPDEGRKKQSTRLVKCECNDCHAIWRMTAKWVNVAADRDGISCPVCQSTDTTVDIEDGDD